LRTSEEAKAIARHRPFQNGFGNRNGKLQVAMFSEYATHEIRNAIMELSSDEDLLEMTDRELYWMPKGNFLDSELDLKAIERILGPLTI
jgi:uncharacterized protein (DUF1697 family)